MQVTIAEFVLSQSLTGNALSHSARYISFFSFLSFVHHFFVKFWFNRCSKSAQHGYAVCVYTARPNKEVRRTHFGIQCFGLPIDRTQHGAAFRNSPYHYKWGLIFHAVGFHSMFSLFTYPWNIALWSDIFSFFCFASKIELPDFVYFYTIHSLIHTHLSHAHWHSFIPRSFIFVDFSIRMCHK